MKRKLGDTLLDLELVLDEMVDKHDLQWGDILNIVRGHLEVHRPDAQEQYTDGSTPIMYYGPKKD